MITFDGVEEQTHRTDTDYMYMLITSSNRHRRSVAQMHTPICLNANFSLCVFCLLHTGHGKKIGKKIGVQANYVFCLLHTGHGVANVLQL